MRLLARVHGHVLAEEVERLFKAAAHHGLRVRLHAEQLSNQQGAALAAQYRALSADHLEYLDDAGAKAMASAGTVAVLLPGAFYALQEKRKPPVALLRKHKVPIAIATEAMMMPTSIAAPTAGPGSTAWSTTRTGRSASSPSSSPCARRGQGPRSLPPDFRGRGTSRRLVEGPFR